MTRKRLVLAALLLVLACTGSLVANAAGATIEVSQPTYLTVNSNEYDRNPSITFDGSNYWLFWTKGDDAGGIRGQSGYNPDADTYVVYYKTAATIPGLASAAETKLALSESARPANFDQRVVSATYFNGKVYAFVSSGQSGTDKGLYYYEWGGSSWSGPTTLIADATAQGGHVNVASDANRVYIVWESTVGASSDCYTWDGAVLSAKVDISDDNQPKITLMGTTLYVTSIEDGTEDIEVYSAAAAANPSFSSHSTAVSAGGFYDPCIFNDGTNLYLVTAPYVGAEDRQYLVQTKYGAGPWPTSKKVSYGGYGSTTWWDYWPVGYHDGTGAYVFFTTETDSPAFSDGEIAYIKMDWDLANDHYFYIQNAVDQASSGDTINVAAGLYSEQISISKSLNLVGDGESTTTIEAPTSGRSTEVENGITWDYVVAADGGGTPIDAKVQGFTIDANGQEGSSSQSFAGVWFRDVGDGSNDGLYSSTVFNFGAYGAVWSGTYNTWMGSYGVVVYGDSALAIDDNDVDDYSVSGVSAVGSNVDVTVSGNDLDGTDSDYAGMYLRDGVGTVSDNNIHDHDGVGENMGIYLYEAGTGVVVGNSNTVGSNYIGIFLKGTSGATICGNSLTDNSFRSVVIQQNSDNNEVKGNTIAMTGPDTQDAVYIGSDSGGNVIGAEGEANAISMPTSTTLGGVHMPLGVYLSGVGASDNTIQYNTIDGAASAIQIDGNTGTTTVATNTIGQTTAPSFRGVQINGGSLVLTGNTLADTVRPVEFWGAANVTITGNMLDGTTFDFINAGSFSGAVVVNHNGFVNVGTQLLNNRTTTVVDATENWWGDASGPSGEGPGSGAAVSTYVDYSPWWGDATGTFTVTESATGELEVSDSAEADDVQNLIDAVSSGTTIVLPSKTLAPVGGFTIDTPGVTIKLADGTVIQGSSPCFTVNADDTTITSATFGGAKCVPTGGDHGIVVTTTVSGLVIDGIEIDGSGQDTGDGIHIGANVANLQILDNSIHDMDGDGVEYATGVTVSGVHEVQGNLFQNNTGDGINNATGSSFDVEYNSWGHIDGPASGDGVSGIDAADYTPWTQVALSMASSGSPVADQMAEGYQITYTVKLDAKEVVAADFDLSFDTTKLTVVSIADSGLFTHTGSCDIAGVADINASGVISFCGASYGAAVNGSAQEVYTVLFEGVDAGAVTLDLDETCDEFGMSPPAGGSTNIYASALADGSVTVVEATAVTGRIDLQGRRDDTGAAMTFGVGSTLGYGPFSFSGSDYWGSISASGVSYVDTYAITVSMPRYLDVIGASAKSVSISADDQVLSTLVLLGGDADDDDAIDIVDAGLIGAQFGTDGSGDPRADINADSDVDILDLVLVGGNYDKTSAAAYSAWTP
jgi:parallel beta-helix repeat protein